MTIDKMKLKVLGKLFDEGYTEEKAISAIGLREIVELRTTAEENAEILELQNAVKKNKVIGYLAGESEEPKAQAADQNSYL